MSEVPPSSALLFDSSTVAAPDRFGAIQEVLVQSSHPTTLDMAALPDPASFQLQAYALGPKASMFTASGPAMRMCRRWYDDQSVFALSTQPTGLARVIQNDACVEVRAGSLHLVEPGGAYDYSWSDGGSNISYQLTMDAVGLDREEIAAAAPRLPESPLADLVRDNLLDLHEYAQVGGQVYQELSQTIIDLTRALLLTVLPDEPVTGLPDDDSVLWSALCAHVRRHMHQPSLSEATTAESLGITRKRLRLVAEGHGTDVASLITARRLHRARADLISKQGRVLPAPATLASVAARWCFATVDALLDALAAVPVGPVLP